MSATILRFTPRQKPAGATDITEQCVPDFITVEPGVKFLQLYKALKDSGLMLDYSYRDQVLIIRGPKP